MMIDIHMTGLKIIKEQAAWKSFLVTILDQ